MKRKLPQIIKWALSPLTLVLYAGTYVLCFAFTIFTPIAIGCLAIAFIYGGVALSTYILGSNLIAYIIGLIPSLLALVKFASLSEESKMKFENAFDDGYMAIGNIFEVVIVRLAKLLPLSKTRAE